RGAAVVEEVVQRLPRHELHDDVRPARFLVGGVDQDAARVDERAGQAALAAEALDGLARRGVLRRDELQGDPTSRRDLLGLVDLAHAPAAQLTEQAVATDGFWLLAPPARDPPRWGPRRPLRVPI